MNRIYLLLGVLVLVMACPVTPNPPGVVEPEPDAGEADGGPVDAGLFEIGRRDAGELITDSGLPWTWASVQEVISIPPSADGAATGRWVPVRPNAVDRAWAGGVLLFDGRVVAIPFNESSVLVINPANDSYERWPVTGGAVAEGWQGGVLLPDGTVIAFPRNANRFLRIDPVTRTAAPFGDDLSGTGTAGLDKFRGGVLALNGLVYAAPSTATFIARLNPATGAVTRVPLPPTIVRGGTQGAVLFPTGDVAMFPLFDTPGLLVIPSMNGASDEVWLMSRPQTTGAPAFTGGPVITGIENAIAPPQQNGIPLKYEAGRLSWEPPVANVDPSIANAWFYAAWSTNGHLYAPPFGTEPALVLSLSSPVSLLSFDSGAAQFRSVFGAVALPDGRILSMPHARSSWLELSPAGRRTLPMEAFTSPFLNKL